MGQRGNGGAAIRLVAARDNGARCRSTSVESQLERRVRVDGVSVRSARWPEPKPTCAGARGPGEALTGGRDADHVDAVRDAVRADLNLHTDDAVRGVGRRGKVAGARTAPAQQTRAFGGTRSAPPGIASAASAGRQGARLRFVTFWSRRARDRGAAGTGRGLAPCLGD